MTATGADPSKGAEQFPAQRQADRPEGARDPARESREDDRVPPAGPHARPDLTDREKTPGTGALPNGDQNGEADPGSD
ncbi:hypothetical protein SLNSH_00465 [Alsobacter soli]|uniref:Uncharacterized protein n=1 Tax=Alsobacter soli TaxID=2109933 RepID=A0A2T1HZ45_9HYPH|nr:hypothetical protein [Alsobacter soli]PSC06895.1 hypothetical protein SLNSH_00465 [Alsobacter soli]